MVSATDGSAFTGSVSCLVTIDSGAQGAGGGAVTHEGNGYHSYAPTQAETNGDHLAFTFTGTGAVPATVQCYTDFPQTGDAFVRLGAPAGASVSADVAAVQADTDNVQTRLPAALVGGRMDANTSAVNNVATGAARLALSTQGIVFGTVGSSSTTTSIVTSALDPAAAATDQFKGRIVTFQQGTTTANLKGQSTDITASTAAGILTVTALTTAPVSGDVFVIT
jgi:hypothetical protein